MVKCSKISLLWFFMDMIFIWIFNLHEPHAVLSQHMPMAHGKYSSESNVPAEPRGKYSKDYTYVINICTTIELINLVDNVQSDRKAWEVGQKHMEDLQNFWKSFFWIWYIRISLKYRHFLTLLTEILGWMNLMCKHYISFLV